MTKIDIRGVYRKWQKVAEILRNSLPTTFRIVCADAEEAAYIYRRISGMANSQPDQGNPMVVCQRDDSVYVIKTNLVEKVVIIDDR